MIVIRIGGKIVSFVDRINSFEINKRILLLIFLLFFSITGGTYAYLFYTVEDNDTITGNLGNVDLELKVTKVLPVDDAINSVLIFQFSELASNLNNKCINEDGDYSLCQLYKIHLKNKSNSVNVNIKGSLAFNNATMPNLSWILLGNNYNSSTNYTSSMLGTKFYTATSYYKPFVDGYLLNSNDEIDFYILFSGDTSFSL